jgi:hypothetical protein
VLPVTDSAEIFQGPSVQITPRIPLYDDTISSGILDALSNPSKGVTHADPSKSRVMLVDGTSVMYRSYYKILGQYLFCFIPILICCILLHFLLAAGICNSSVFVSTSVAQLQHGQLEHADGNGDWVLTIFKALSLVSRIFL